jgi:hypothetical protein
VPDRNVATGGLRRMAIAIVTLAGALGVAMVSAFTHLDESTQLLVYWVPGVCAVALLAMVWCVLDVERARLPGFGRIRLALGAAMLVWWAAVLAESIVGYIGRDNDALRYFYPRDNGWLVVGPVIAMLGLALISSGIAAGGAAIDAVRRDSLAARNIIAIVLGAFGVLLAVVLLLSEGRNAALLAVLAMGFVIAALVVLASMVALLARAIDELPGLPTARQV